MKHHDKVIYSRLNGSRRIQSVFIDDYGLPENRWFVEFNDKDDMPSVSIADEKLIPALDLRFVYGLNVHACSKSEARAKALFRRLQMFGPAMCTVAVIPDRHNRTGAEWIGIYTKEKGVLCE